MDRDVRAPLPVPPPVPAAPAARPLRIAFFVTYFPKVSEVFLLHQALALLDRGHDVRFHALAPSGEAVVQPGAERFGPGRATVGRMPRGAWRRILDLPRLLASQSPGAVLAAGNPRRYGREATSLRALYRLDATPAPVACDVAHAQFGDVARQCLLLRERGRLAAPLVVSFRGGDLSSYLAAATRHAYRDVFREAAACLPVATRWVQVLESLGCPPGKIRVLPSGVPMERVPRRPPAAQPAPVILSAGRLERHKGIHLGLEVIARLRLEFPALRYEVFGDGPERRRLERQARMLGIAERVRWHGAVTHAALMAALPEAALHLFTTVTSPRGRTEGVPNILKETQAAGIPAAAFAHPGTDEVVEDGVTGWLVPEGDVDALADRARRLLADPPAAAAMGIRAAARSRARFDLARVTDQLETIYRAVEAGHAPAG